MLRKPAFVDITIALCLVIAGLIVFSRTATNSFISLDDPDYVTSNSIVQGGLSIEGTIWAFTTTYANNWHPMTWLSHMLDVQLFGLSPGCHQIESALLHIVNTVILFFLLWTMTGKSLRSGFVAALFLLHPLHVESVAWVSERKDVLCTLFSLLTLWAYVRFTEHSAVRWYAMSLVFFAFALMSKPMAVTLPFVLLLVDWWPLGRFPVGVQPGASSWLKFNRTGFPRLLLEKIPFLVLSAGSSVMTLIAQNAFMQPLTFRVRLTNALRSYAAYLGKTVWPSGLSIYYPHPGDLIPSWEVVLFVALLASLTIMVTCLVRRFPYLAFGWFWYMGTLVPVIGIVQVGAQAMADRYTYVPLIGIFIAVSWGISDLAGRYLRSKWVLPICSATVILALAAATWAQLGYWKNEITLYRHAVDVDEDNWVAQNSLGALLGIEGRYDEAISHLEKSIRLNPTYADPYFNLGVAHYRKGERQEAVRYYAESLRIEPNNTDRRIVLGKVLEEIGRRNEAMEAYQEVLRIEPDNKRARDLLDKASKAVGTQAGSRVTGKEAQSNIPSLHE